MEIFECVNGVIHSFYISIQLIISFGVYVSVLCVHTSGTSLPQLVRKIIIIIKKHKWSKSMGKNNSMSEYLQTLVSLSHGIFRSYFVCVCVVWYKHKRKKERKKIRIIVIRLITKFIPIWLVRLILLFYFILYIYLLWTSIR